MKAYYKKDPVRLKDARPRVKPKDLGIASQDPTDRSVGAVKATPNRADKIRLGDIYSKVIYEKNIRWGIENGYLSDIRCLRLDIGYHLDKVKRRMGDFAQGSLAEEVDTPEFNHNVADIYKKKAKGPTLIFTASVAHAEHISALIPKSEVIYAGTPDRAEMLQRFRDGKTKCLINCMVLTEGTDLPMVETIIMCRPTQNASLYTQCVGRGTRLYEGKKELLLIDCVGDTELPLCTAPILFNLNQGDADQRCTGRRLTEIEKEIAEESKMKVEPDWMEYLEEVRLFHEKSKDGGYDMHDIFFTKTFDGAFLCSLGDGQCLRINAEDMAGNTDVMIISSGKVLKRKDSLPMQDAFDFAYGTLASDYKHAAMLWDGKQSESWRKHPVSKAQKDYLKALAPDQKFVFKKMTKGDASLLISQLVDRKKQNR